jgi:hypothetical protein
MVGRQQRGIGRTKHVAVRAGQMQGCGGQGFGLGVIAGDDNLGAGQMHVECVEQRKMTEQVAGGVRQQRVEKIIRSLAPALLASEDRKTQQILCDQSVVIGDGVVDG